MSILNESLADRLSSLDRMTAPPTEATTPPGGQSYVRGPTHPPLAYVTIPQLLGEAVSEFGSRDAVVFHEQGVRMS